MTTNTMKFKKENALKIPVYFICLWVLFSSCSSSNKLDSNPIYFQEGPDTMTSNQYDKLIHPFDMLSIQVYSKTPNQEQAAIFNIFSQPNTVNREQAATGTFGVTTISGAASPTTQGYRVNEAGNIEMPVIGTVSTTSLTIYQLQDYLTQKVANYVKSPAVIVHYLQFDINVLGEVRNPGIKKFSTDRVTIIDAISASGDLTDYGKREDVTIIRREGGKEVFYKVDLRNRNLFKSPVYFLQPNDIVYVDPNKYKLKSMTIDPKAQTKTAVIFGLMGMALSIANIIVTFNHH
jgi:polysaccharide biosynthesis/export protein